MLIKNRDVLRLIVQDIEELSNEDGSLTLSKDRVETLRDVLRMLVADCPSWYEHG